MTAPDRDQQEADSVAKALVESGADSAVLGHMKKGWTVSAGRAVADEPSKKERSAFVEELQASVGEAASAFAASRPAISTAALPPDTSRESGDLIVHASSVEVLVATTRGDIALVANFPVRIGSDAACAAVRKALERFHSTS